MYNTTTKSVIEEEQSTHLSMSYVIHLREYWMTCLNYTIKVHRRQLPKPNSATSLSQLIRFISLVETKTTDLHWLLNWSKWNVHKSYLIFFQDLHSQLSRLLCMLGWNECKIKSWLTTVTLNFLSQLLR